MSNDGKRLRVVIAGGGVAALETALALRELAPEQTALTVIAPNDEFFYRPMSVNEPFAHSRAQRYPLEPLVRGAGATQVRGELARIDHAEQIAYTQQETAIEYDALVLATGAKAVPRYRHATTIEDRRLDETLHGIVQDVEAGYTKSLAFVSPGRMAWPLPLYELALMTCERAYDMGRRLDATIVTPEDSPLAIFGLPASGGVAELLERAHIRMITSAYAEIPESGKLVINPGDRRLSVDRVIALPELFGPGVRGIPLAENGFIPVDPFGLVPDVGPIYAAGDATSFPLKYGGIAAQQADVAALSIAALAGAPVTPEPFHPLIHGILLTGREPRYLTARITGGHGFSSEITDTPTWSDAPAKITARYLGPRLQELDRQATAS